MADLLVPLACGVSVFLLFLLFALSVYWLWKKKRSQRVFQGLIPFTPKIPRCTAAVLQTSESSSYGTGDVPFCVPPGLEAEGRSGMWNGKVEWERRPDLHAQRGSLTAASWFPLGSVRPDLYQLPDAPGEWALPVGSAVRLWFALRYQQEQEQLVVSLLRAANLPVHCRNNATLLKLQLLPSDERRHRQAKSRRKGCEPQFNDSFVFQVSSGILEHSSLNISMLTVDQQKKHHLLGQTLIPLREAELQEGAGAVQWRDMNTESNQPLSKNGDVQVSLNYNQALQRLTVVVLRARGLQCASAAGVCVQVSLEMSSRLLGRKWTSVAKGSSPSFNQRLTFTLLPVQLDTACLTLQVQQPNTDQPVLLGSVVIGPFMYARGRELDHWNDMVSKPHELVRQWHPLGVPQGR